VLAAHQKFRGNRADEPKLVKFWPKINEAGSRAETIAIFRM